MDVPYTVGSGLACIATGDMDSALGVYRYLASLWEQQDELPDRLYYNMSRRTGKVIKGSSRRRSASGTWSRPRRR